MEAVTRKIEETSIQNLLYRNLLVVPSYQRVYSWDEYNHAALWDDIIMARTNALNPETRFLGNHFMSSVIIKNSGSKDVRSHIVDGQQRLLTITLLLKAGLDLLDDNDSIDIRENIQETIYSQDRVDDPKRPGKKMPVTVSTIYLENQPNENFYEKILSTKGVFVADSIAKDSKAFKAYNFFLKKLAAEREPENRYRIEGTDLFDMTLETVLDNLRFVSIPIVHTESPQKIFESVNGLTKELVAGELIKNYLLMSLPNEDEIESIYKKYWAQYDQEKWVNDDKNKEIFTSLLYYWLKSKELKVSKNSNDVYKVFKAYANLASVKDKYELKEKVEKISKEITLCINSYEELSEAKINPKNRLEILFRRVFDNKQTVTATSALFKIILMFSELEEKFQRKLTEKEKDIIIAPAESYLVRRLFGEGRFSGANAAQVTKALNHTHGNLINSANSLEEYLSNYSPSVVNILIASKSVSSRWESNSSLKTVFCGDKSANIFPKKIDPVMFHQVRMILSEIENLIQEENPFKVTTHAVYSDEYTLEHWMPQAANPSEWSLLEPSNRSIYTHCLGNMAILPRGLNSKLSNKSLIKKLMVINKHLDEIGSKETGLKTLDLLIESCLENGTEQWNEENMEARSQWIIDKAFNHVFKDSDYFLQKDSYIKLWD